MAQANREKRIAQLVRQRHRKQPSKAAPTRAWTWPALMHRVFGA